MGQTINDFPELMKDWDYEKNIGLDPEKISYGSCLRVYWCCHICGFSWNTTVANRAGSLRRGCPNCAKIARAKKISLNKAINGNISKRYPNIAREWHPTKNGELTPNHISYGSELEVWWKCSWCGLEYKKRINKRTIRGFGCPNCAKDSTSFPEQVLYYYLSQLFDDVKNRDNSNGFELDLFIPSKNIGIEYDGSHWHNQNGSLTKDNQKDDKCKKCGITLFRIRDISLKKTKYSINIPVVDGDNDSLVNAINYLFDELGINNRVDVDITRDSSSILSLYKRNMHENSLKIKFPFIANEWHPTKNGDLLPEHIDWSSGKMVWWQCKKCGYEWIASPNKRTRNINGKYSGCPKCCRERIYNHNRIQVINLDTKIIYNSITEAAESCNGKKHNICDCLNGNQITAYGYHWAYVDESKRRRKNVKSKIINLDNNMIFENSREAAKWCNGDSRTINRCCNGITRTAYGCHWKYYSE